MPELPDNIGIAAFDKDGEVYLIMYTEANKPEALRTLSRWAINPELSLNWHDLAQITRRMMAHEQVEAGGATAVKSRDEEECAGK